MRHVHVTYRIKPDRVAEHEELIRAVFAELATAKPAGFRYSVYKRADGVSYVHDAFTEAGPNPLDAIAAFARFTANIKERIVDPPVTSELTQLTSYP